MKAVDLSALVKTLGKNKYVFLVLLLGLVLLMLPKSAAGDSSAAAVGDALEATGVPLPEESGKIAELLMQMEGVGRAEALLSKQGAVIVCDGADSAKVRLCVTNAVMSYTGLGSDKISVIKMK